MDKNLYHQMRVDFDKRVRECLSPKLKKCERERLEKLKKLKTIKQIALIAVAVVIVLWFALSQAKIANTSNIFIFILIGIFIALMLYNSSTRKGFETELKNKFLNELCKCFGTLKWRTGEPDSATEVAIEKSCLFQPYNRTSYDDMFKGNYKEVDFEIIEASFQKETDSGENRSTVRIFDGAIIKIAMNKNFKCHTIIRPHYLFCNARHLKRTVLEDVVFEKKYDVYTDNEIEARYLITTAFMERLNNIQKIFNVTTVGCAFYKGDLYIAVYTSKDLFKLFDIEKPLNDYQQFMIFFNEILSIYKCIDYFKLSEKTGL